ncbi:MAG: T9SS type A sorting domain-containing protein [Candidatus Eisenbacteria bacterium]|nr:T9SS type A sorting domain-containing protein [Candidatus Eisenbacteria bacterium]
MESDLAAHSAADSPLTMKVSELGVGEFAVSIAAEEDVSNARFAAAAVLAEDVPSSNGTSFLPYHAKTFLTAYQGDAFSIAEGESVTFLTSFDVDPAWDYSRMGVAAWVQADGGGNPSGSSDLPVIRGVLQSAFAPATATGVPEPPGAALRLSAPTPNPARGEARFVLASDEVGDVSVVIYDVRGRRVATLFEGRAQPGEAVIRWDGRDVEGRRCPSGVYFARLHGTSTAAQTQTVVLIR